MMSRPFSRGQMRPPSQDFTMMNNNNNYLPGVSRLSDGFQLSYPQLGPQTCVSLVTCSPCGVFTSPLLNSQSANQTCVLDSDKMTVEGTKPINLDLDLTESEPYALKSSVNVLTCTPACTEVEMKPQDLCEHQGPLNSNITQNPGWSGSYHTGTPIQSGMNNFTFTTPTQSYLHSPALTATTQNRFINARLRPQTFAPGCNAQWKHSVPRKMPWLPPSSLSSSQGLSVFTGSQSSSVCSVSQQRANISGTNTLYSPQMFQPVASCSELTRRHKRRHTVDTVDTVGEDCPSTKIHLTEDKIASHMRDLRIHNISPPPGAVIQTGDRYDVTSQGEMTSLGGEAMSDTCYPGPTNHSPCSNEFLRHSQRQWHDFKLLEEKLQMIDEDTVSDNEEDKSKCEPVLRIADGINITPKEVLPKAIVDRIRNPCQEIILWSPQILPAKSGDELNDDTVDDKGQADVMEAQSFEERAMDDSGMETEPEDEDL